MNWKDAPGILGACVVIGVMLLGPALVLNYVLEGSFWRTYVLLCVVVSAYALALNAHNYLEGANKDRRQSLEWLETGLSFVIGVMASGMLLAIVMFVLVWFGLPTVLGWFGLYHEPSDFVRLWTILVALLAAAYLPLLIVGKFRQDKARLTNEVKQAEQHRRDEAAKAERRLREQQKAQAKQKEAQAYRHEVERFHRERLNIEQFVVGDEQAGIRSPYEVEMTDAERVLLDTISSKFDPSCLLVDTYLDKGDGTTTQVDIIAVCRQGVIVIESKGLGGTMSGKWDDKEWIQQPSQRRIYNPIRQNDLHVESIRRALDRVLRPAETREDPDEIPF